MTILYKFLITLIYPGIYIYLKLRQFKGKENKNPKRFAERFGLPSVSRPTEKIIWFHGASLGEINSVTSFMYDILNKYIGVKILLTYTSSNADKIIPKRFKDNPSFICQYIPVDIPFFVERFINHWNPSVGFFIDSELWPSILSSVKKRKIPMFLLNARVTSRTFRRFSNKIGKKLFNEIIDVFDFIFATSRVDEKYLKQLSNNKNYKKIKNFESLKYSANPPKFDEEKLKEIRDMIKERFVWVAVSTHKADIAEEDYVFSAHLDVLKKHQNALLIICPRQPNRVEEIVTISKKHNLNVSVRSKKENITDNTQVYIADTIGEMGLFYSLSDVIFIGRSLVNLGGSNPIEAMKLRSVTITGPYYQNFKDMIDEMLEKHVIVGIKDEKQLGEIVLRCFNQDNIDDLKDIIERSYDFVISKSKVKEKIFETIKEICDSRLI